MEIKAGFHQIASLNYNLFATILLYFRSESGRTTEIHQTMKKLIFLFSIFIIAVSCKKLEKEPIGPTDVRVLNQTTSVMSELTVNTGGGEFNFGTLNAGSYSNYHRFEKAYSKANISAMINGQKYKTDTAIYTWMQYMGLMNITYEVYISNEAQKKLSIFRVVPDSALVLK